MNSIYLRLGFVQQTDTSVYYRRNLGSAKANAVMNKIEELDQDNRFKELLWGSKGKERNSCRRDPSMFTLIAFQHVPAISVVIFA